jgi:predicted transcriptional regulator
MIEINPKRRDSLLIVSEILNIAKKEVLKTNIMYRANLSYTQSVTYLRRMLELDLLQKVERADKVFYCSTEKGQELLQKYQEVLGLLSSIQGPDYLHFMI